MNTDTVVPMLFQDGPRNRRLVGELTEFEGNHLLDLRFWFWDRTAGEFRRSRKGISLNKRNFEVLVAALHDQRESILDWLGGGYVPEHIRAYAVAQAASLERARVLIGEIAVGQGARPRDPMFFEIEHKGGRDVVNYNCSHPLGRMLIDRRESDADLSSAINAILVCYARAKVMLSESSATDPDVLFDQLEYNWSQMIRDCLERRER